MKITLDRVDEAFRLKATNVRGDVLFTDGSLNIGGTEDGWRPMEVLLVSLAACSAIDIISVLKKQRQQIEDFKIEVSGTRKEGIPSPYKTISVHYIISGKVKESKMQKVFDCTC